MRWIIRVVLLVLACDWAALSAAQLSKPDATETEFLEAVERFYAAFLAGDFAAVRDMTAADYLQTDVNGKIQTKEAWLAEYYRPIAEGIKGGTFKWEVFDRKVESIRMQGDVGVLLGTTTLGSKLDRRTLRFTQVWVKRRGRWQRLVFHNAWLP